MAKMITILVSMFIASTSMAEEILTKSDVTNAILRNMDSNANVCVVTMERAQLLGTNTSLSDDRIEIVCDGSVIVSGKILKDKSITTVSKFPRATFVVPAFKSKGMSLIGSHGSVESTGNSSLTYPTFVFGK